MLKRLGAAALAALAMLGCGSAAHAQEHARIQTHAFHSPALEGNWEGNTADRTVLVVTPPGYDEHPERRYPVVYFLHGYWATPQMYQDLVHFETAVDEAAAAGHPMIVVIPDGQSRMRGSFYSSSPTTGDFETYVTHDLVSEIDGHFRTIASRESRGLAGHSMGGYGTWRLGMKYPQVFSSIYAMSACCFDPREYTAQDAARVSALTDEAIAAAEFGGLGPAPFLAAWSPDPAAPQHVDTGLLADGTIDPAVRARVAANSLLPMLPQYLAALRQMEAIGLDVGDEDSLAAGNQAMHEALARFGVTHEFEIYPGGHGNRVAERIRTDVLPFFGNHLDRE